jgi:predicted RNA-binding protein
MPGTIELYNILKDRLGEEGSSAIAETFEEVAKEARIEYKGDLTAIRFEMATKSDIAELRTEFRGEFKRVDGEFKRIDGEFKAIRSEMATKADIAEILGEFKRVYGEFNRVDGEFKRVDGEFKRIDGEFKSIRMEMKLYFLILLFVILATNPKTIDLVTKLLSAVK